MKCPLFLTGHTIVLGKMPAETGDCLKEECAWWGEEYKICAIKLIPGWLASIAGVLCEKKIRKARGLKL